jgi:hypothetical protein
MGALLLTLACGETPTNPMPPARAVTGIVEGFVYHDAYLFSRILIQPGPQRDALVTVTEGPAAGATFVTGVDGAYRFELPAGAFRLRWTATTFETRESESVSVRAGETTKIDTVTLRALVDVPIPEWSVSGTVVDGRGIPVEGASILSADGIRVLATGQTDAAGNFRLTSTHYHPNPVPVTIRKDGYQTAFASVVCVDSCAAILNVRLLTTQSAAFALFQ